MKSYVDSCFFLLSNKKGIIMYVYILQVSLNSATMYIHTYKSIQIYYPNQSI